MKAAVNNYYEKNIAKNLVMWKISRIFERLNGSTAQRLNGSKNFSIILSCDFFIYPALGRISANV